MINKIIKIESKKKYILVYTVFFVLMSFAASLPWIMKGASFVWKIDGVGQHYPALVYFGQTLRQFVAGLFNGKVHWNMWDLNIGFGSDVLGTLNYYCFGDPLDLLAVFVPKAQLEYLYDFLIILRIYLSGLAFSFFAFYKKAGYRETLIGAFTYAFSGYVLMYGIKHPLFTNPLIYLPLLLIGLDKILKKEKSLMFTVMVTIALVSNFYFFYILTIAMVLYALYRVWDLYSEHRIKEYAMAFVRCTLYYLVGIINSMIIFLPVLYAFSSAGRSSGSSFRNFLFKDHYYYGLLTHIVSIETLDAQTNLGYFAIPIILFTILVCKKERKYNVYRIFGILSVAGLVLPVVGFGMTGFSYVANRWVFLFTFVMAMGVVRMLEDYKTFRITQLCLATVMVVASAFATFLFVDASDNDVLGLVILVLEFILTVVALKTKFFKRKGAYILIMLLMVAECGTKMVSLFVMSDDNIISQFVQVGKVNDLMTNDAIEKIKSEDKGTYRIESMYEGSSNYSLINDVATVSSYYSITPGVISETMEDLENADIFTSVWMKDLSRRTGMLELAGVKYYLIKDSGSDLDSIPYNYKLIDKVETATEDENKNTVYIYENKSALPLVYGYDNYMKKEQWAELDSYDKENAMLQVAVMEKKPEVVSITKKVPQLNSKIVLTKEQILKQIKNLKNENIEVNGEKIYVKSSMVTVPLNFKALKNSETYLSMKGIGYNLFTKKQLNDFGDLTEEQLSNIDIFKNTDNFYLGGIINNKYAGFKYCTKDYIYNGSDNALCNYGYSDKSINQAYFYMSVPGEYTFADLKIVSQPMTNYENYVNKLKINTENINIGNNKIQYDVNLKKDKLVCMAVPYSKGWTATIDGKKVEITKVNDMYMGICIVKGKHKIKMSYVTPGLKLGEGLSAIGWMITIGLFFLEKKVKK